MKCTVNMNCLFFFLTLSASFILSQCKTIVIQPAQDAMIVNVAPGCQDCENMNFGDRTPFILGNSQTLQAKFLIEFPLSSIPKGVTLNEVTLHLHLVGASRSWTEGIELSLYEVQSQWEEMTVTAGQTVELGPKVGSIILQTLTPKSWHHGNVTAAVEEALFGEKKSLNIMIIVDDVVNEAYFSTRESSQQPHLRVDFTPPEECKYRTLEQEELGEMCPVTSIACTLNQNFESCVKKDGSLQNNTYGTFFDYSSFLNFPFQFSLASGTYQPTNVSIGCNASLGTGFRLEFTSPNSIREFLPQISAFPAKLTKSAVDPRDLDASGGFAGELLSLKLALLFDNCISDFSTCDKHLKDLVICESREKQKVELKEEKEMTCAAFCGMTIEEFFELANRVLGDCENKKYNIQQEAVL